MDSDKFQSVDLTKSICPVPGIKVLVVDSNLTFLESVSKMLRSLGYEVVTASLASEALSIVEEKKNELNLVFVDLHLPDVEINALIEKIREISNLPYFLMTADDNLFNTSIEPCNGSKLFFKKPIMISDLSGLWKFATRKKEEGRIASEDVRGFEQLQSGEIIVNNSRECQPFMNAGEEILQSAKRKVQELKIGEEQSESLVLKRKRLSWTDDSRTKFLGAVDLAGPNAPINQVHQLWNVPEITRDNDTNYLQRFHQPLEQANPIQQHSNIYSSNLNLGSQHLSQTVNDIGERIQLGNSQIYVCHCMYLHSLCNTVSAFSISSPNGQISSFGQSQLFLPWEMFGVAYYTCGSGNGEASADISQVENTTDGKVFSEDSHVYCGDDLAEQSEMDFSTLLADDMCQEFPPLLPVPLLPSDEKEHGNFGAEAGQVDEIFYPPNGIQQFSDEDLKIWLARFTPRELRNAAA